MQTNDDLHCVGTVGGGSSLGGVNIRNVSPKYSGNLFQVDTTRLHTRTQTHTFETFHFIGQHRAKLFLIINPENVSIDNFSP